KIYENVSQQAWGQWMEHCKMLLNEYRLNPARKQDQEVIVKQMEQFFFGEGSARPAEYVPPRTEPTEPGMPPSEPFATGWRLARQVTGRLLNSYLWPSVSSQFITS